MGSLQNSAKSDVARPLAELFLVGGTSAYLFRPEACPIGVAAGDLVDCA
jgi:hypothetical protein